MGCGAARRPGACRPLCLPARPPPPRLVPALPAGRPAGRRGPIAPAAPRARPAFYLGFNEKEKKKKIFFFSSPPATASRWRRWRPYHVTGGLGSGDRRVDAAAPPPPRRCHGDERRRRRGRAPPRPCSVPRGSSRRAPRRPVGLSQGWPAPSPAAPASALAPSLRRDWSRVAGRLRSSGPLHRPLPPASCEGTTGVGWLRRIRLSS